MRQSPTPLGGAFVIELHNFGDERGRFTRLFCERELSPILDGRRIVQVNHSVTSQVGTVRGMHYQRPPMAEVKLVSCIRGRVWDVIVDVRVGSPTFLRWHGEELSSANRRTLVVPEGFAHGFQVLEAGSELLYLHTAPYAPECEAALSATDPSLAIRWPLPVEGLSLRDKGHPHIGTGFVGVRV